MATIRINLTKGGIVGAPTQRSIVDRAVKVLRVSPQELERIRKGVPPEQKEMPTIRDLERIRKGMPPKQKKMPTIRINFIKGGVVGTPARRPILDRAGYVLMGSSFRDLERIRNGVPKEQFENIVQETIRIAGKHSLGGAFCALAELITSGRKPEEILAAFAEIKKASYQTTGRAYEVLPRCLKALRRIDEAIDLYRRIGEFTFSDPDQVYAALPFCLEKGMTVPQVVDLCVVCNDARGLPAAYRATTKEATAFDAMLLMLEGGLSSEQIIAIFKNMPPIDISPAGRAAGFLYRYLLYKKKDPLVDVKAQEFDRQIREAGKSAEEKCLPTIGGRIAGAQEAFDLSFIPLISFLGLRLTTDFAEEKMESKLLILTPARSEFEARGLISLLMEVGFLKESETYRHQITISGESREEVKYLALALRSSQPLKPKNPKKLLTGFVGTDESGVIFLKTSEQQGTLAQLRENHHFTLRASQMLSAAMQAPAESELRGIYIQFMAEMSTIFQDAGIKDVLDTPWVGRKRDEIYPSLAKLKRAEGRRKYPDFSERVRSLIEKYVGRVEDHLKILEKERI